MDDTTPYADLGGGTTPGDDTTSAPTCICDGTGWAGAVLVDGRDVVKVCVACRPHLAQVPTVAERNAGHGSRRRRRLTLVR